MTRRDCDTDETIREVVNVHYVTRNGRRDDSGGELDGHALPHPSLRFALPVDEIGLHSASSHMYSSSDARFQDLVSNGHQDVCNPGPDADCPHGNEAVSSCHPVDDLPHLLVHRIGIDESNRLLLYSFTLFMAIIVTVNSALIIWIMRVMNVSTEGMGRQRMEGEWLGLGAGAVVSFEKELFANRVSAGEEGSVLRLLSPQGISLNSGETKLFLGSERAVATAQQLVVRDQDGKLQLLLDHNKRLIAASSIRVNNDRALRFNSSIQAPYFSSIPPHDDWNNSNSLRIESPSRATRLLGPQGVHVKSSQGQVAIRALRDLKFISKSNRVIMNASSIKLEELRSVFPTKRGRTYPGIMQLCICADSGRLFMSSPEETCVSDPLICTAP